MHLQKQSYGKGVNIFMAPNLTSTAIKKNTSVCIWIKTSFSWHNALEFIKHFLDLSLCNFHGILLKLIMIFFLNEGKYPTPERMWFAQGHRDRNAQSWGQGVGAWLRTPTPALSLSWRGFLGDGFIASREEHGNPKPLARKAEGQHHCVCP